MKATMDGVSWAAADGGVYVFAEPTLAEQGTLIIAGTASSLVTISLQVSFVTGPGTYPLGVSALSNAGGCAQISDASGLTRITRLNSTAGTVAITTRTTTRIAGTFQFVAWADTLLVPPQAAGADVVVTAGEFDITLSTGLPPLPTGQPDVMSAVIDGAMWDAAYVWSDSTGFPGGALNGATSEYAVFLGAQVPISAGNVYKIGSQIHATVIHTGTGNVWAVTVEDQVGQLTVLSADAERVECNFQAVLATFGSVADPITITGGYLSIQVRPRNDAGTATRSFQRRQ